MKILMLTWEFPPFISGGLGTACYGIARGLLKKGVEVSLVLPSAQDVYFPLRRPGDVDLLPVRFLDSKKEAVFKSEHYKSVSERLLSLGISSQPESYLEPGFTGSPVWERIVEESETSVSSFRDILRTLTFSEGENIFKKVREMTMRAFRIAQDLDFDVVHAHDWLTVPAAVMVQRMSGKPLVLHVHATEFDRAGGWGDERIHRIEWAGMEAADRVIAVSNYTAEMVHSRYSVDTGKLRVVHNAYEATKEYREVRPRRLFKDPTVLFLGRITLQKGPDYFLEVASRIHDKHPEVHFIMAGGGDMMNKMIHRSASHRLRNRFLFTGFLNHKQVQLILRSSDIFVMPSISEPFGIAPLEAMARGVLVIISKNAGVAEVVKNAYKIDFWDIDKMVETIDRLIGHPEEVRRIAREGAKEVHKIEWDIAVEKIIKIYKELSC